MAESRKRCCCVSALTVNTRALRCCVYFTKVLSTALMVEFTAMQPSRMLATVY